MYHYKGASPNHFSLSKSGGGDKYELLWINILIFIILYKGEQHGFRKSENIQKALDGEFYFFSKVFGFEAADNDIKVTNSYIFCIF